MTSPHLKNITLNAPACCNCFWEDTCIPMVWFGFLMWFYRGKIKYKHDQLLFYQTALIYNIPHLEFIFFLNIIYCSNFIASLHTFKNTTSVSYEQNFNQTAGQVAHKSYPSCVVRATGIAMEAYNNSHYFNLSKGQVTKNVASSAQNEPVIGLEDGLLLTHWTPHTHLRLYNQVFQYLVPPRCFAKIICSSTNA